MGGTSIHRLVSHSGEVEMIALTLTSSQPYDCQRKTSESDIEDTLQIPTYFATSEAIMSRRRRSGSLLRPFVLLLVDARLCLTGSGEGIDSTVGGCRNRAVRHGKPFLSVILTSRSFRRSNKTVTGSIVIETDQHAGSEFAGISCMTS